MENQKAHLVTCICMCTLGTLRHKLGGILSPYDHSQLPLKLRSPWHHTINTKVYSVTSVRLEVTEQVLLVNKGTCFLA